MALVAAAADAIMILLLAALTGLASSVRPEVYGAVTKSAFATTIAYLVASATRDFDEPSPTNVNLTPKRWLPTRIPPLGPFTVSAKTVAALRSHTA